LKFESYWFYHYFDLIPHAKDTATIHTIRQLAIDVCALYREFCPTREEIHEFPIREHLLETEKLYERTRNRVVLQLRDGLRTFFAQWLDVDYIKSAIESDRIRGQLDGLSREGDLSLRSKMSFEIHQLLLSKVEDQKFNRAYRVPYLTLQSYLSS
jgi:hypothetical protein